MKKFEYLSEGSFKLNNRTVTMEFLYRFRDLRSTGANVHNISRDILRIKECLAHISEMQDSDLEHRNNRWGIRHIFSML